MSDLVGSHAETSPGGGPEATDEYEPPRLESLGTLAELTRGGTVGPNDGSGGGAGSSGSLP